MANVALLVLDEEFMMALGLVTDRLGLLIDEAAEDLADSLKEEGGKVSTRLGADWPISGDGPDERHVTAPEWWAHFLAGGTAPHGPRTQPRLAFSVDGQSVFAHYVRGLPPNPFDERAISRTSGRLDEIIGRVMR